MSRTSSFIRTSAVAGIVYLVIGALLLWAAPAGDDGGISWTAPMIQQGWMAWTLAGAAFFYVIAGMLLVMTLWTGFFPQPPRVGILRFPTTPGDRLFVSLLGSAFICLAWLAAFGAPLNWALAICLVWWIAVFRFV